MPLRGSLHERAPKPVVGYARGLARSVVHNVPAYGFSMVTGSTAVVDTVELRHPTALDAFLFLVGAACAFALLGAAAAFAFEEERIERASPHVIFLGSVFSVLSTSAGFGAALLVVHHVAGGPGWVVSSFCATIAYVLVLALEFEVANLIHRPGAGGT